LYCNTGFCQSLSIEKIEHIKECTVRVTIEGDNHIGTGFFVKPDGTMITCWHVISPAYFNESGATFSSPKKIIAISKSGERIEYVILNSWLSNKLNAGMAYDFCVLVPFHQSKRIFPYLQIGSFKDCNEGDEVYTCGYPLAIGQQFVTKGFISNKYSDSIYLDGSKKPRNLLLMDMTMNRGNSGGAIVKLGKGATKDEVIGIANFIIIPISGQADSLIRLLNYNSGDMRFGNFLPIDVLKKLTEFISSSMNGISGGVSIDPAIKSF
jgi:serine protease Do